MRHISIAILLILLLTQCEDPFEVPFDPVDPATQYAYFPLETGRYIDYQVDSVVFDFALGGGTSRDSSRTYVRELIGDTLRDITGALQYEVERYERKDLNTPWTFIYVETASRNATQAIRTENNLRFLKLVFPMDRRTEWDGNLWIDPEREISVAGERMRPFVNWQYEVDTIDQLEVIGPFVFDSVLTITEVDEINAIEYRVSRAKYAKNVGLIWREQWILDSQYCNQEPAPGDCLTIPWVDKAERGYIVRQTVIGYE